MGNRTIDESSMDKKEGMNYSECVAILSGNIDLLDKARLEKKPPLLNKPLLCFSIKDAMNALEDKTVINNVPKPNNKDAPAQSNLERRKKSPS